jgi:hypothetical protein
MIVKDVPRCNNLVTDAAAPGNTRCCLKVAGWTVTLAHGDVYHVCIDCLARRLAIIADAVDTATVSYLIRAK